MRYALVLLIGLSGIPSVGLAQPSAGTLPIPGKEAQRLAHAVLEGGSHRLQLSTENAQKALFQSLVGPIRLYKPASCDPALPACKEAAQSLAAENAGEYVALRNAALEDGYATFFEGKMSPQEMADAKAFATSPAGAKFTSALTSGEMPPLTIISYVGRRMSEFTDSLYDRFLQKTASLPRRVVRGIPPPPRIPSSGQKRP